MKNILITHIRKLIISVPRKAARMVAVVILFLCGTERAPATLLYATAGDGHIYQVDTLANTAISYHIAPDSPDSLMFDTMGNVIYTAINVGLVRSYNPNTTFDSVIASGLNGPVDVALEPGGNTMLVSKFGGGGIDRINLVNPAHPRTPLVLPADTGPNPEGIAFDSAGNLFANLGVRGAPGSSGKYVAKINPITGLILSQTKLLPGLDGLTYDSYSHMLYAASLYNTGGVTGTVYQIDPTNLNNVVDLGQAHGWSIPRADGITSDGSGHIFVASAPGSPGDGFVYDINLMTFTLTKGGVHVSDSLDDLAPASGLGAPPGEVFATQECWGKKPHFEDPAYATVFTGQVAVATCFADLETDAVLVVEDLKNQATAPLNTNYAPPAYHGPASSWTKNNLGDIFGLTFDDFGNIYVTATTAYGTDTYPAGGTAMDIYKIDGGSGAITLFKALPQSPATLPGAGLGNIAYDGTHKNFYVSNIDDGLIYRLDLSGNTLSTWDHGVNLPTAYPPSLAIPDDPKTPFTALGRRVWGLQAHNNRLYYAVWWEDAGRPNAVHANEIWSVALSSSGNFVLGTDQLEVSMPADVFLDGVVSNYSNPVSDISFGPTGTMLLAERTMADDTTPDAHEARALEYMLSGISWIPTTSVFSIGVPGVSFGFPPLNVGASSAGGTDYDFGAGGRAWVTGDALQLSPVNIYGLQGLPASGGSILDSILIDLNGVVSQQNKTQIGDVEIPCPSCKVNGTVVTPANASAPYTYQFTITNNSTVAASTIVILPISGVTSITPQTILLSPALQPGQTSQTFTLTLNGAQPGVEACFNMALVAADGTACCSLQLCVPIPSCFEVLSQIVTCLPNGQVKVTVTLKNLEPYTLYYASIVPSNPAKTATPPFFTLGTPVPPFGTTTVATVISPVAFGETVFYTLTIHASDLSTCCSRVLSFTANCKRIPIGAASRLTHGASGAFDIAMPLTGTSGVEDRDGSSKYLAVFTFDSPVSSGEATIVSGTATAGAPIFSGNEMQVPLTEVADQQNVTIELSNLDGEEGTTDVAFGFLKGDVNGDRTVKNTDVNQIKADTGQLVTGSNFRDDINLSGRVDKPDSKAASANKNHSLP